VRGRLLLGNGDHIGAATDAGIILELDPYRESATSLLIRAHVAAGNPAQAVAAYEQLRATLEKELGTRPSAEAQAVLHQALEK